MDKLLDLYLSVCSKALSMQDNATGAMPPGHNGPYYDQETPVRNTSHWLVSFIKAFKITGDEVYNTAAKDCLNYLLQCKDYRNGHTFIHRSKLGKDRVNGVIGSAWNIEALVNAYNHFSCSDALELAFQLQRGHFFDSKLGVWKRYFHNGEMGDFDFTFNHQLWFAAASTELYNASYDSEIERQLQQFFANIHKNLRVYPEGLVKHSILDRRTYKAKLKNSLRPLHAVLHNVFNGMTLRYKEQGYHLFNLYAFAKIYKYAPGHTFFKTDTFKKILNYAFSEEFINSLYDNQDGRDLTKLNVKIMLPYNRYGFPYNAPGFELPVINNLFNVGKDDIVNRVIGSQFDYTFEEDKSLFYNNTDDPITLTARIYELSLIF